MSGMLLESFVLERYSRYVCHPFETCSLMGGIIFVILFALYGEQLSVQSLHLACYKSKYNLSSCHEHKCNKCIDSLC